MVKFVSIIFILQLFIHPELRAQDWLPLEVGNTWQYLESYENDWPGYIIYSLSTNSVESDTVINSRQYFEYQAGHFFRYDSADQKIMVWCDGGEFLFMDFNLPPDSNFIRFQTNCDTSFSSRIIIGYNTFNDSTILTKGFYESNLLGGGLQYTEDYYYFAKGLGILRQDEIGSSHGGFYWNSYTKLIQANLNGINYSENYKPELLVTPVTAINDTVFNLIITVNHEYNRVFADTSYYTNLNFIDTVKMESFYSNGADTAWNPVACAANIPASENWGVNILINLNLLMNNYDFYYRFIAVDKGLVPHYGFAPDSGFFKAVYDTASGVNDFDCNKFTFELDQNYPNPFNPATTISFTIPEREIVSLSVFNILGEEVSTLINEERSAGSYSVHFAADKLSSGIYFYRLQAGNNFSIKKMTLLK